MKEEVWAFIVDSKERLQEVPSKSVQTLMDEEDSKVFPKLGGKTTRMAVIRLRHPKGRPRKIAAIEFRCFKIKKDGSLDPKFRERRKRMTVELASIRPQKHVSPKVVDASRKFKERRFHNEFSWTPTVSMVQQLSAMIHDKTKGALKSRDIMYQILNLTATA